MKRKLLLLLVALLPMIASAYPAKIDGIYYVFSGDNATVTYQKYQNYTYMSDYTGEVVIPESVAYNGKTYSVTSIGSYAFLDCTSLTSITIPNSVTSIGYEAFRGCSSLTSITIPNSVTSIGYEAFRGCSSLTSITIPNSVTSIGSSAFNGCSRLTSITIPNSVTSFGSGAFHNCTSLTSITIPNSVTSIGYEAFYGCTSLTSITIPNSVTSIGDYAFYFCTSLTSITIPNSVTSIGSSAFSGCSSLTSITIPNGVTSISDGAFSYCSSLTSIQVETGNTTYDSRDNCNAIIETATNTLIAGCQNTTIPNSVTSIGVRAFYGCSSLTSITIPNSVTSIDSYTFQNCSSLTSITIPNSVTSIGSSAFYNCTSLTSITIPNSVTSIGSKAFSGCTSLTSITIPKSVTSIGHEAFYGCSSLTSITIPNSVTSIGEWAFSNCSSLTSITIPNSVTSIGDDAFARCTSLTEVYCYVEDVPETSSNAFRNTPISSATLHVPTGLVDVYKFVAPWSGFGQIVPIENILTYIVDGEVYKTYEIEAGTSITPESAPTKEGYTFSGWSEIPETMPDHDVTVTGSFILNNYSITYFVDGQVYKTYTVAYGSTITPEPAPTKEGYTFSGWTYIPPTMPATDVVVMGTFTINSYTLTYEVDGEVYKSYTVEYGAAITPEPEPTKEGYTFSGWSEIPTTMPDYDVTVTGTFTKIIIKCATPIISYANGKLTFSCETEGAICHSTITDTDIKSYTGNEVDLTVTYHISVYATKEKYEDSEVATGTLCWIDQQPSTEGIVAEDAVTEVKALPVLIQSNRGTITVQGANEGTEIHVYSINGMNLGSAIATNGLATIITSLKPGTTAIVKIGEKAIKVLIK